MGAQSDAGKGSREATEGVFMRLAIPLKRRETTIVACVFLLAACGGAWYFFALGALPAGSTADWFGPSAMWALGRGFVAPNLETKEWAESPETKAFREFLALERASLNPEDIPKTLRTTPVGAFHRLHCYLFYSVAAAWKIFGVRWSALALPIALMFGLCAVAAYSLFRLALGRTAASLCIALFVILPSHLSYAPNIRDYGKAPFIMAALAIMGYMATRPLNRKRLLLFSTLLGLDIGFGLGFRFDLILMLLVAMAVILAGLPCGIRKHLRLRLAALGLMLLGFAVPAWPVLRSVTGEQDVQPLHIMEGLAPVFDDYLGVGNTSYRLIGLYNDALTYDTAVDYAYRVQGIKRNIPYCNEDCTKACRAYLAAYVRHFPADVVMRALAATLRIAQYAPLQTGAFARPLPAGYTENILPWLLPLLMHLRAFGPCYVALMILLVTIRHFRAGITALLFLFYLGAYSSLQFDPRHTFHLAFIPVMGLGVIVERSLLLAVHATRPAFRAKLMAAWRDRAWIDAAARSAVLAGLALWLTIIPLLAVRGYQKRHLGELFRRYDEAARTPLPITHLKNRTPGAGVDLYRFPDLFDGLPADKRCLRSAYVRADFAGNGIRTFISPQYTAVADFNDYSKAFEQVDIMGATEKAPLSFFFPVFDACPTDLWGRREFMGLCVSSDPNIRLISMARIDDITTLPFLMTLTLPSNRDDAQRYQTLKPGMIPAYLGKALVARHSILGDGGFEQWKDEKTPVGFNNAVRSSRIEREEKQVAKGRYAVRQTWERKDAGGALPEMFYVGIGGMKPKTKFGLRVRAMNLSSNGLAVISIWQILPHPDGYTSVTPITSGVIAVFPGAGFQDLYGVFETPPGENLGIILATHASAALSDDAFPFTVIWDEWQLAPLPK